MSDQVNKNLKAINALLATDPQLALSRLRFIQSNFRDDETILRNQGGVLIDLGYTLGDSTIVQEGIECIYRILLALPEASLASQLYNLGNGYSNLEVLTRRVANHNFDPIHTPLLKALVCYRAALQYDTLLGPAMRVQLRINLGNCLSELGRTVEAIYHYDSALKIDPRHPMALGNLGESLFLFAHISRDTWLLHESFELLSDALASGQLQNYGYPDAESHFAREHAKIAQLITRFPKAEERRPHKKQPDLPTKYMQRFAEFCLRNNLFLNLDLPGRASAHPLEDQIRLSLIVPIDDQRQFLRLSRVVNDVTEAYALSRLLVFEAYSPPYATEAYDELSNFSDNLDYAVYGIRAAKLKAAFQLTYSILDKLSIFLNTYLNIHLDERGVDFGKLWQKPGSATLRPEILQCGDRHLYGLYYLSRDLAAQNFYSHLRTKRDYLAHRYLIPHVDLPRLEYDADGPQYHTGYNEFFMCTIELLKVVRVAIIYFVAFIDQEERRRHPKFANGRPPATMLSYRYKPFKFGPDGWSV